MRSTTEEEQAVKECVEGLGGSAHDVSGDNREFGNQSRVKANVSGLSPDAVDDLVEGVIVEVSRREWIVTAWETGGSGGRWEFRANRATSVTEAARRLE